MSIKTLFKIINEYGVNYIMTQQDMCPFVLDVLGNEYDLIYENPLLTLSRPKITFDYISPIIFHIVKTFKNLLLEVGYILKKCQGMEL